MLAATIGLSMASAFAAPQKTVTIPLAGKSFGIVLDGFGQQRSKNLNASSAPKTVILSTKYKYKLSGSVRGTGDFASIIPAGTDLATFLESLKAGSSSILVGTIITTDGTLIKKKTISGSRNVGFFSVGVSLTVQSGISSTGVVSLSVSNIKVTAPIPVSGTVLFEGATATKPGAKLSVTSLTP